MDELIDRVNNVDELVERLNEAWRKLYGDGDEHGVCDTLAEAADALEAAREDEWQPIETAPRGVVVLLLTEGSGVRAAYRERDGMWVLWSPWCVTYAPPGKGLGWRPLPAPPAIDQARGRGGCGEGVGS